MSINFIGAVWDSGLYDGPRLLMMLALADHADNDGWCYPNYDTLALKIRRNVKTVYRVLSELEADGAIKRHDGRIGICEPHILAEVQRRADSRRAKQEPQPPPPVLNSENDPPADTTNPVAPLLNSENAISADETPILISENEILNTENPILTSENEILNSETPFFIDPSTDPSTNRQEPPTPTTADPPATAGGGAGAGTAPDVPTILRWINFTDRLNAQEQTILTPPTALAWTYFVHLEEAKPTRPKNAIGLARSRWRATPPVQPPADLLALAHVWLTLTDDGRRNLLDRLDFAARWGTDDDLDDDFPGLPVAAALALYRATAGELAPPQLSPAAPVSPTDRTPAAAQSSVTPHRSVPQTTPSTESAPLWRDALTELEMQMTRATFTTWLQGTTATLDGDQLTVHVRNRHAIAWLENRLHDLIQRTVTAHAGRPITVTYAVPEVQP